MAQSNLGWHYDRCLAAGLNMGEIGELFDQVKASCRRLRTSASRVCTITMKVTAPLLVGVPDNIPALDNTTPFGRAPLGRRADRFAITRRAKCVSQLRRLHRFKERFTKSWLEIGFSNKTARSLLRGCERMLSTETDGGFGASPSRT
jgi:hypothetical protein